MADFKKRETAYKLRIGDLLRGKQIFEQNQNPNQRLQFIELGNRRILRVNIIGNVVDKFESEGERKFASITLDDGSGQIRARVFGEDISKFKDISQGDTLLIIGLLRSFNQELYILPEIMKKADPKYLLVRKLEIEKEMPKQLTQEQRQEVKALRDEVIDLIKNAEEREGIDKEEIIMKLKANPALISQEIKKLLEEGIIYEPRPGRVRYLG
ncbi:MAG: OB-fold nucleic acid binding domain-containing protein [Candidatus Nanoarchaeia archaeon]|nr:OB-fold nucleic acid binding domain-containing protein [Candidatus Nanoarchaeia archaeon]MDD5741747.1 OB-fold nucleic acid binding domain-containing protein [Candidatus Nanoarchaeia archaeon]